MPSRHGLGVSLLLNGEFPLIYGNRPAFRLTAEALLDTSDNILCSLQIVPSTIFVHPQRGRNFRPTFQIKSRYQDSATLSTEQWRERSGKPEHFWTDEEAILCQYLSTIFATFKDVSQAVLQASILLNRKIWVKFY